MTDGAAWLIGGMWALVLGAMLLAMLVRVAGVPGGRTGAAVLGGVLAGVLLGPGVAGRIAPQPFERAFVGGVQERREVEEREASHAREIAVVDEAGVTGTYVADLRARHEAEIVPLRDALQNARASTRARLDAMTGGLVAAHLILTGLVVGGLGRLMHAGMRRAREDRERSFSAPDAIGAAALIMVVGVLTPVLVALWVLHLPARVGIGIGLAMAIPAIGAEARPRLLACALVGVAMGVAAGCSLAWGSFVMGSLVGGGAIVMLVLAGTGGVRLPRDGRRGVGWILTGTTLPVVAALTAMRCDPQVLADSKDFWIVAVMAVLISSDARWVAVGWAQRLFPRGTGGAAPSARVWTGATGIVNSGAGMAQLTMGLVLHSAGLIAPEILAGLVAGAVAIEMTRGIRTRVGWMMDAGGISGSRDQGT